MTDGIHSPNFSFFEQTGFDINVLNSTSDVWDAAGFLQVSTQAFVTSGAWGATVIQAQCSADGVNFVDIPGKTLTSAGVLGEVTVGTEYFRVKVTTAAGVAGVVTFTVNLKR